MRWWEVTVCTCALFLASTDCNENCVLEEIKIWKFPAGEDVTVTVEGDTRRGCKFVLEDDGDRTCCYMNDTRREVARDHNSCGDHQSKDCISETRYGVAESRGEKGKCILRLNNFQPSDTGEYRVEFPHAKTSINKKKTIEIHEKKTNPKWFDIGDTATISVKGDIEDKGCKFVKQDDSESCCYEAKTQHLCEVEEHGKNCRNSSKSYEKYTVVEEKNKCILLLYNFQASDGGAYKAFFPSDPSDNEVIKVWKTVEVEEVASIPLIWILYGFILLTSLWLTWLLKKLVQRSLANREAAKKLKGATILKALKDENSDLFKVKLGTENILKVKDINKNNVFHMVANKNWTQRKTEILKKHCSNVFEKKKIPTQLKDAKLIESQAELSEEQKLFSAKIPKWVDYVPNCIPNCFIHGAWLNTLPGYVDLNSQNMQGETPLIIAADKNKEEIVTILLEKKADPNITDKKNLSAIEKAILNQDKTHANVNIVNELLENNATIQQTEKGPNLLHNAVSKNKKELLDLLLFNLEAELQVLLKQKWEITYHQKEKNVKETKSETPLELAVRLGYQDIIKCLLDAGDKTWLEDHGGMALVFSAATGGHSKIVDLLLEDQYGGRFDPEYRIDGVWCLEKAITDANSTAVNILLAKIYDSHDALALAKELLQSKLDENNTDGTIQEVEAKIRDANENIKTNKGNISDALALAEILLERKQDENVTDGTIQEVDAKIRDINEYIKTNKDNISECEKNKKEKSELGKQKRTLEQIEKYGDIVRSLKKPRQSIKQNIEAIDKKEKELKELQSKSKENQNKMKQIEEENNKRLEETRKNAKIFAASEGKLKKELAELCESTDEA